MSGREAPSHLPAVHGCRQAVPTRTGVGAKDGLDGKKGLRRGGRREAAVPPLLARGPVGVLGAVSESPAACYAIVTAYLLSVAVCTCSSASAARKCRRRRRGTEMVDNRVWRTRSWA